MKKVKINLNNLVQKFKDWLNEEYTQEQIDKSLIDECASPYWDEIVTFYSYLLQENLIVSLDKESKENLLYLIARNWDIGSMISWLSQTKELSNAGELTEESFISLAKVVVTLDGNEYNDAKAQIASSLKKLDTFTTEIEEILLKLYNDRDEYTKRLALVSLGKFRYIDIEKLLEISWNTIDDEHHKMASIGLIKEYLDSPQLLKKYLDLASLESDEYLQEYVKKLKIELLDENEKKESIFANDVKNKCYLVLMTLIAN